MSNHRYILFSGLILGLFAVIGTTLVGITHEATAEKIADNERLALLQKLNQILPADQYDNDLLNTTMQIEADDRLGQKETTTLYIAKQRDEISAFIFPVIATRGYSGEIRMLVGINIDGTVAGVRVISHKETPGLGDAIDIERSDWVLSFDGKSLDNPAEKLWKVKRDGGVFDQFTGATITPRAVVQATQLCLIYFDRHRQELLDQFNKCHKDCQSISQTSVGNTNE